MAGDCKYRIEDTNHILKKINELNEAGVAKDDSIILVSWDISAMFPSIDNEKGLKACHDRLEAREIKTPETNTVMEALQIALENNISRFEDKEYCQTSGTAMGPSFACSYGDITVDRIIDVIVMSCLNPWLCLIILWARLRDDIFCPWKGSLEELLQFHDFLNSLDPKLKFEMKYSTEKIEFLDVLIYKKNGRLETMVYSKPCDPHAYLLPTSYHPIHICESIPFSVLSRVKKICSEPEKLKECTAEYIKYLKERGYSDSVINKALEKLEGKTREELIEKKSETQNEKRKRNYPLVMKYNVKLPPTNKIIKRHEHILTLREETANLFPTGSIFYPIKSNLISGTF